MGKEETLNYAFPPKVVNSARNNYRCYGCLGTITAGRMYIANPVKNGNSVKTLRLCLLCAMLLKDKPDSTIKEGGFSEKLLPNCLRKKKSGALAEVQAGLTTSIIGANCEMITINFIASTLFIAGAICRLSAGEYLEAALGFCCAIQMWVIEYLRFILEKERELREACNHLALKTLKDLSEEFKKKHREQLERQKDNEQD